MTDRRPRSPMRDRNRDRQEQPRGPGYDHRGGFRRDNNRRPDEPPRRDDRRNDRDYRRRSRSPRRDRREDKYAKDKDNFGLPDRGAPRAPTGPRDGGRRDRDRSRSPRRERDSKKDDRRRSRSPRRDRERDSKRDSRRDRDTRSKSPRRDRDRVPEPQKEEKVADQVRLPVKEDELTSSRVATPPVSFKVGGTIRNERPTSSGSGSGKFGQDHDRMEVDKPVKKSGSSRKEKVEESDDDVDIVVEDDGLAAMQAMMGFGGFGTTHQKKVAGNDISAVRKEKKTEYRQYMNRVGGFNRPLDEM